jgi:DnaJ-class molecular chaperone
MDLKTSFTILGIDQGANEAQAKHAYKAQVRRWHPDQFPEGSPTKVGAEEQLKQINIAYARVKAHLAIIRPDPGDTAATPPPRPPQRNPGQNDSAGEKAERRSWVDHLFDTLNAFAGNHDGKPDPTPAREPHTNRRQTFGEVLDEMAGGNMASAPKRQPGRMAAARHNADACRRCRRRGGAVVGVGATESPGPIKPVSRVRGIGRNR